MNDECLEAAKRQMVVSMTRCALAENEVRRLRDALEQIAQSDRLAGACEPHCQEIARAALQQSHAQDYLAAPPTHPQED